MVRKKYNSSLHIFYENPPPKLVLQMLFFSLFYQWCNQNFGRFISVCNVKDSGNGTDWINPRAIWPQKLCLLLLPGGWKECPSYVLSSFEVEETVESRYWGYLYTLMRCHPMASIFMTGIKLSWKLHSMIWYNENFPCLINKVFVFVFSVSSTRKTCVCVVVCCVVSVFFVQTCNAPFTMKN